MTGWDIGIRIAYVLVFKIALMLIYQKSKQLIQYFCFLKQLGLSYYIGLMFFHNITNTGTSTWGLFVAQYLDFSLHSQHTTTS